MRTITLTSVLEWLTTRLGSDTPKTTLKLYFELLDAVLTAAAANKVIPENPCDSVKLPQILRGRFRAPKWVPTEHEVLAPLDAVRRRTGPRPGWRRTGLPVWRSDWARKTRAAASTPSTANCTSFSNWMYSPREHDGFFVVTLYWMSRKHKVPGHSGEMWRRGDLNP